MKSFITILAVVVMPILLGLVGCGSGSGYEFGAIQGKVTLDGKPLGNVEVTFKPAEGPRASGEADATGNFTLMSSTGDSGALVGEHKVMVRPNMIGGAGSSSDDGTEGTAEVTAVPLKFQDIITTDLTTTVNSGDNSITIELTSK